MLRALARSSGYSTVVVLTVALSIAAATTIFSFVNDTLLQPVPLPYADRLMLVWATDQQNGNARYPPAIADLLDFGAAAESVERMVATRFWFYTLELDGRDAAGMAFTPEQIHGWKVEPGYFQALGIEPMLGRAFTAREAVPGDDRVAIITHDMWQRRFDGAPDIIGRSLRADGLAYTVIGVLPADFYPFRVLDKDVELWLPFAFTETERESRESSVGAYALLKPGVTMADAQAELDVIAGRLERQYPTTNRHRGIALAGFSDLIRSENLPRLQILSAAVGVVMLLAGVNVAGLMLMRGATRRRESAIRLALGAGRWRVARHTVAEGLVLALAGGALGLVAAGWGIPAIGTLLADSLPPYVDPRLDWTVAGFAGLASVATALAFSAIPALVASREQPADALGTGGIAVSVGAGARRVRSGLVVGQLGFTLALLAASGLMLQTVHRLTTLDRGVDLSNRLTLQLRLTDARYDEPQRLLAFYEALLERIRALPGVEAATASSFLPLSDVWVGTSYDVEGRVAPPEEMLQAAYWVVSDDFFDTLDLPLRSGRAFSLSDGPKAQPVAVVSAGLARVVWPDGDAGSQRLRLAGGEIETPWSDGGRQEHLTVVGVADDYLGLNEATRQLEQGQAIYVPFSQNPRRMMHLIVHTSGPSFALLPAVRDTIAGIDPRQPVAFVRSYEDVVFSAFDTRRVLSWLLTAFTGLAVALALVGTYGLVAFQVTQQRREFALRMALGASRRGVVARVAGQAGTLLGAGLGVGLVLAVAFTRSVQSQLFGVGAFDLPTYSAIALVLAVIVALATWIPARRAMTTEPAVVLREE